MLSTTKPVQWWLIIIIVTTKLNDYEYWNTEENLGNLPLRAKAICSPFFTWDLSLWRCKSRFFFHVWWIKLFIGAWLCGCRHFCRFFLKGNQLLPNRISASEHFHYFLGPWILRKNRLRWKNDFQVYLCCNVPNTFSVYKNNTWINK